MPYYLYTYYSDLYAGNLSYPAQEIINGNLNTVTDNKIRTILVTQCMRDSLVKNMLLEYGISQWPIRNDTLPADVVVKLFDMSKDCINTLYFYIKDTHNNKIYLINNGDMVEKSNHSNAIKHIFNLDNTDNICHFLGPYSEPPILLPEMPF